MIIDAHQHFWRIDRGDYGWLTPASPLYRDFLPPDLAPWLAQTGVDRTVVVQAAPTVAETEYLLALAEETPFVAGVVGWLDLEDSAMPKTYERLRRHPKFVGVRPMLQDLPDPAWVLRPKVLDHLRLLARDDFPVDLLIYPLHLPYILRLLDAVPDLRAVIDHLAKPPIRTGELDPWREQMTQVAACPNVWCKLSGMVTEADHRSWQPADIEPYAAHVLSVFGPLRVMFGSDWPVCTLAADYMQVYHLAVGLLPAAWGAAERAAVMGGNAATFYRLPHAS
ncbi:hydrolase [Alicyclobacillus cellulosilyticus]|uniref:Hydrolase n=1 Tax=Alicyclobacillus cellulosilyticus TaxID=1003997 RepID=A0A917KH67_9BACL|nr:amidohydrolase family protein [Alicyclobacillus cellulosilyticus]GGJ11249.1 hydrolase [Alicyclobacillus cellulosilyticus]